MPQQLTQQARRAVRELIQTEWTPTNVHGYDVTQDPMSTNTGMALHYGNYTSDLPDPQISLAQPQGEFTSDGVAWSGLQSGQGLTQFRTGFVLVQCWATGGNEYRDDVPAERLVDDVREEVERCVGVYQLGYGELESLSPHYDGTFPDPEAQEARWQAQLRVRYQWNKTP